MPAPMLSTRRLRWHPGNPSSRHLARTRVPCSADSGPRVLSEILIAISLHCSIEKNQKTLGWDHLVVEALGLERPARTQRPHPARHPIAAGATSLQRKFGYPSHRAPVPPRTQRLRRPLFGDREAYTAAGGEKLKDPGSGLLDPTLESPLRAPCGSTFERPTLNAPFVPVTE